MACKNLSLDSILNNETCVPISLIDFQKFLTSRHNEENLEFLIWFKNYNKIFTKEKIETFQEYELENLRVSCHLPYYEEINDMLSLYFSPNSVKELNIDQSLKVEMFNKLKTTTHPIVFKPIADQVYEYLLLSCYPSFIKMSKKNINTRSRILRLVLGILNSSMAGLICWSVFRYNLNGLFLLFALPLFFFSIMLYLNFIFGFCLIYRRLNYFDQKTEEGMKRLKVNNPLLNSITQNLRIKMLIFSLAVSFFLTLNLLIIRFYSQFSSL